MNYDVSITHRYGKKYYFPYQCESQIYCPPNKVRIEKGLYRYELWGAGRIGGGAYVRGDRYTFKREEFYIFVGGVAQHSNELYGYVGNNGGGNSTIIGIYNNGKRGIGGDGSTDIRLNISDFRSRVIVSGAPGGAEYYDKMGYAGGLVGHNGTRFDESDSIIGEGANQTSGGKGQFNGEFGIGANCSPGTSTDMAGAGGAGWYGGGSGYHWDEDSSGGGGSSYISGFKGCESILYDWRFENTIMLNGSQQFTEPDGAMRRFGHKGSGFCIITCIADFSSCENLCFYQNNIIIQITFVFTLMK